MIDLTGFYYEVFLSFLINNDYYRLLSLRVLVSMFIGVNTCFDFLHIMANISKESERNDEGDYAY